MIMISGLSRAISPLGFPHVFAHCHDTAQAITLLSEQLQNRHYCVGDLLIL
jgi:hypothetical protein